MWLGVNSCGSRRKAVGLEREGKYFIVDSETFLDGGWLEDFVIDPKMFEVGLNFFVTG